jgi:hypothetical protein
VFLYPGRQELHLQRRIRTHADCDQLVAITNDSDLTEPIRVINKEMKIPVGVFYPHTNDTAMRKSFRAGKPESVY